MKLDTLMVRSRDLNKMALLVIIGQGSSYTCLGLVVKGKGSDSGYGGERVECCVLGQRRCTSCSRLQSKRCVVLIMRSHVVVVLAPDPSFSNFVYDEVFKSGFEAGT